MGIRIKGFDRFTNFFNERRRRDATRNALIKRIRQQCLYLKRDMVDYIDSEKHGIPNSPLTILTKGSSRPLVDHGDLRLSINYRVETLANQIEGGVGVLRTRMSRSGKKLWNIAIALHEGYDVIVTDAVRRAVFAQMRERNAGKKVTIPSDGTAKKIWHVKGRPFVEVPFEEAKPRIIQALGDGVKFSLSKS